MFLGVDEAVVDDCAVVWLIVVVLDSLSSGITDGVSSIQLGELNQAPIVEQ